MTVLRMPVRVRLELAADLLEGDGADGVDRSAALLEVLEEATRRGTARAAERAGTLHAVRRAVPSGTPPEPVVRFRGDPLPGPLAERVEAAVRTAVAATAARLLDRPTPAVAPEVRPSEEPLDGERLLVDPRDPACEFYAVPSYDHAGRRVRVPIRREGAAAEPAPARTTLRLRSFASMEAICDAVVKASAVLPHEVLVVARWRGGPTQAWVFVFQPDGSSTWTSYGEITAWVPSRSGSTMQTARYAGNLADQLVYLGRANTAEERRAFVAEHFLLPDLLAAPNLTPAARRDAPAKAARQAARFPWAGPLTFYEWRAGGASVGWLESADQLTAGTLPVLPLTEEVPLDAAAVAGYGKDCGPLNLRDDDSVDPTRPYLSEEDVDDWPPNDGAYFRPLIEQAAQLLRIDPGRYVGSFVLGALDHIVSRCPTVGLFGGEAAEEELRRMAAAMTPLTRLARACTERLNARDRGRTLPCPLAGASASWGLHFDESYFPLRADAVGAMFKVMCQRVLLSVLEQSASEIEWRRQHFSDYMVLTRLLLLLLLNDTVELTALRERLLAERRQRAVEAALAGNSWEGLVARMTALSDDPTDLRGRFVRDANGRLWTLAELDAALVLDRRTAIAVDPLMEKVQHIPLLVGMLRGAQRADAAASTPGDAERTAAVDRVFANLLDRVAEDNAQQRRKVERDWELAFGLATVQEADIHAAGDLGATLSGIHRLADAALRPLFEDEDVYVHGMRKLVDIELGFQSLRKFLDFVALPLLCAVSLGSVAVLIGGLEAVSALRTANEHRDVQRAMLGGDAIITQAQAEAEVWGARIGAALAFLPVAQKGYGLVRSGAPAVVRGEGRAFVLAELRGMAQRALLPLTEATAERFALAWTEEMAKNYIINIAFSRAVDRFTAAVARQVEREGRPTVADLPAIVADALRGADPGSAP